MLTTEQERVLGELDQMDLDNHCLVSPEEVDRQLDELGIDWQLWGSGPASATPVGGATIGPPSCSYDGNSPCASCDCCQT